MQPLLTGFIFIDLFQFHLTKGVRGMIQGDSFVRIDDDSSLCDPLSSILF